MMSDFKKETFVEEDSENDLSVMGGSGLDSDAVQAVPELSLEEKDIEKGLASPLNVELIDQFLVTWKDENDPTNPKNWRMRDKWLVTIIVSCFLLATLMASTIISPALPSIGKALNITNDVELQTTMSVFVLGYAAGPLFLAPLSEMYGRVIVIQLSNAWFVIWCLVCGFAKTKAQMIAARFMAGIGGSAALAIGGGILSDVWHPSQRGKSLAIYNFVPLLGPALGPLIGGYIAQRLSWSWSFWILAIFEAVLLLLSLFTFHETYAPTILSRKASRVRKETRDERWYAKQEETKLTLTRKLSLALSRPTKFLLTYPIIQVLSFYSAYSFGLLYIVHSTFPTLWTEAYHQSTSRSGLNFISIAVGFTLGVQVGSRLMDWGFVFLREKVVAKSGKRYTLETLPLIPEHRIPLLLPVTLIVPIGLLIYGWTAQYHLHWILPNVGIAIFSGATTIATQVQTSYTIDTYPEYTASALAAISVMKSLAGFSFPLFAPQLYKSLGWGGGNSLLAGVAVVLGAPMAWGLWVWGSRLRGMRWGN
ncbi:major facilitator superfamily domain-containing protein [Tricladium varicosporioides]|nr:major facilitator superfamily domain-containing protein [Hymenoscyphus varicosporioides]